MNHVSWIEIESFHNIRKYVKAHPEILNGCSKVTYMAKCKLHGTNAAVQVHNDLNLVPQSRTSLLSIGNDNCGFARWVSDHIDQWLTGSPGYIYFGEWIGSGVQKGVACSQLIEKQFAVFAARKITENNGSQLDVDNSENSLMVSPEELSKITSVVHGLHILPWYSAPGITVPASITIDWLASVEELAKQVDEINSWVNAVEINDPWIDEVFGIKGIGEGLVFYPVSTEHRSLADFNNLVFKAKGSAHKNIMKSAPAQIDASTASSIDDFVNMVLTVARLEQGVTIVNGGVLSFDMKQTGNFVTWIQNDIKKETVDELEASGLTYEQVSKSIAMKARAWYLEMAKK